MLCITGFGGQVKDVCLIRVSSEGCVQLAQMRQQLKQALQTWLSLQQQAVCSNTCLFTQLCITVYSQGSKCMHARMTV